MDSYTALKVRYSPWIWKIFLVLIEQHFSLDFPGIRSQFIAIHTSLLLFYEILVKMPPFINGALAVLLASKL